VGNYKIPIRPTSETSLNKTVNLIVIENIKSSKVKTIYVDNMYFYKSNNNGENIKTRK
jgi:ribosomal protein L35AE/L33A